MTRSLPELRRSPALTSNVTRRADVSAMRAVRAHDVQLDCCHCGMHTTGEWDPSPRSRAGGRGGGPSGRSSGPGATVPRLKVKANTSDLAGAGIERTRRQAHEPYPSVALGTIPPYAEGRSGDGLLWHWNRRREDDLRAAASCGDVIIHPPRVIFRERVPIHIDRHDRQSYTEGSHHVG